MEDYLKDLGYLGVPARIKRLNDSLFYGIRELYRREGIDIEPSWHLVFLILEGDRQMTMKEMAQMVNISKPAITKMVGKMFKMGYINIGPDKNDQRKKVVSLTKKAADNLPKFKKVWLAGQQTIEDVLGRDETFMNGLFRLEQELFKLNFEERASKILNPSA